jgi:hypothetical protein
VVRKLGCISALEVLQKVQTCPLQYQSPLACIKESCPAGRNIDVN